MGKKIILNILAVSALCGCTAGMQAPSYNQSKLDSGSTEPTTEFAKASVVITQKCASCHCAGGQASFAPMDFLNEDQFVQTGLVIPGDVDKSKLIHRSIGYSGPGPGTAFVSNMPLNGNISGDELTTLKQWVVALGKKEQPATPSAYEPFVCEESQPVQANALQRLTQQEMINTIGDLVSEFASSDKAAVTALLEPALGFLPQDTESDLKNITYPVTDSHIRAYWEVAKVFSEAVTANSSRITALAGSCFLQATVTDTCLNTFIQRFGLWTYRRPVTAAEKSALNAYYKGQVAEFALSNLVARFLLSPQFLYHLEVQGTDSGKANEVKLTEYELASKLSYQLRGTMPNQKIFDAAANGQLSDSASRKALVDELFASDARVKDQVGSFFADWLDYKSVNPIDTASKKVLALGSDLNLSSQAGALRTAMVTEVKDLLDHHLWNSPSDFRSLLTTRRLSTSSNALAKVYGLSAAGSDLTLPEDQRSGLLTRAAFIVSGSEKTDPIHIGVKIYRNVLCQELPDPPGSIDTSSPSGLTELTASHRDIVADKTSKAACIGCHAKINPIGFAFEAYDALGRYRNDMTEKVFDSNGNLIKTHSVSTQADAEIARELPVVSVQDAVQLIDEIADSNRADACLVRNYQRYTKKRLENDSTDGCSMKNMYDELTESGGTMQDMFKASVLNTRFGLRSFHN